MVTLREFKAKQLVRLMRLKEELLRKYPARAERVNYIVDILATKLSVLRTYTLSDYLFTLYNASKEFPEFMDLIPREDEIDDLLSEKED